MPLAARAAVLAVLLAAGAADAAHGASITYVCGNDLCRVSPSGGEVRRLTRDGTVSKPYHEVHNVRDSPLMAYDRGSDTILARPDNSRRRRIGGSAFPSTDARGVGFFTTGGLFCWSRTDRARRLRCADRGFLWWKTRRMYGEVELPTRFPHAAFCRLRLPDLTCARVVARPPRTRPLRDEDVSSDGRWVVAAEEVTAPGDDGEQILGLYDARTGRRVRTLSRGHHDESPSFSPDGRLVVFGRDDRRGDLPPGPIGRVCVVARRGGPVRCLARGARPAFTRS